MPDTINTEALLSEIQAATDDYVFNRQPEDIYFKSNVLLYRLLSQGKTYNGGLKLQANLEYGKSNTGSYGPKSLMPVNKKEIITSAFFTYGAYFATLTIDMNDQLLNSGEEAKINLVKSKIDNAQKSIRDTMGSEVYGKRSQLIIDSGDPNALPFIGLGDLFNADTSVPYGEIKEDDLYLWAANVISAEKTISFAFMQELRRTASTDTTREGKPDLYLTTEELQDAFERTLQPQARYSDKKLIDAGFENVLFKGASIVADDNQAEGTIDALNTKYLQIKSHKDRNFTAPKWQSPIRQPDTMTANIRWAGQLLCTNRKAHARASNVIPPA